MAESLIALVYTAGTAATATAPAVAGGLTPLGTALATGAAGAAVSTGVNALTNKGSGIVVPPPPGAAMIDPAGSAAAAAQRRRQAAAGGLGSTITGAGQVAGAGGGPTSGGKTLSGQ